MLIRISAAKLLKKNDIRNSYRYFFLKKTAPPKECSGKRRLFFFMYCIQ